MIKSLKKGYTLSIMPDLMLALLAYHSAIDTARLGSERRGATPWLRKNSELSGPLDQFLHVALEKYSCWNLHLLFSLAFFLVLENCSLLYY